MAKRITFFLTTLLVFVMVLAGQCLAAVNDFNNDGLSDIISLYEYPGSLTKSWVFQSNGSAFNHKLAWIGSQGGWDGARSRVVGGDFNKDGFGDLAVLYNYGDFTSKIHMLKSDGNGFTNHIAWQSGPGAWSGGRSKLTSGDYNKDGFVDLAVLYDYGNGTSKIFMFLSDGNNFTHHLAWESAPGSWFAGNSNIISGDFNGDGYCDIAILYDYGNGDSKIFMLKSDGTNFTHSLAWTSGPGAWDAARSKLASGDFNNDGLTDLAVMYAYPNATTALFMFRSDGLSFSHSLAWQSGAGSWDGSRSRPVGGDFDADPRDDLAIIYDYPNSATGIFMFKSDGTHFAHTLAWKGPEGTWEAARTRVENNFSFAPRYVSGGGKAIDINLSNQTLTAFEQLLYEPYEFEYSALYAAIFSTLVSSGRSPFDTPAGNFAVYWKDPVVDMSGFGGTAEYYYVPNVPYVLWFTGNYSIHGAYWHNDFGNVRSHGCVNVPVDAGAWLYNWAPVGTPVNVHY